MTDELKDFMCLCTDEGKAEVEAMRKRVFAALSTEESPCTYEDVLTRIVYDLNWEHNATIEMIPNDMWSAVIVVAHIYKNPEPAFRTYIQCDQVEDGVMRAWEMVVEWHEAHPDWKPWENDE